jgi:hypothetical protein
LCERPPPPLFFLLSLLAVPDPITVIMELDPDLAADEEKQNQNGNR